MFQTLGKAFLLKVWYVHFNVPRKSHAKYELKTSKDKGVIEVSL